MVEPNAAVRLCKMKQNLPLDLGLRKSLVTVITILVEWAKQETGGEKLETTFKMFYCKMGQKKGKQLEVAMRLRGS